MAQFYIAGIKKYSAIDAEYAVKYAMYQRGDLNYGTYNTARNRYYRNLGTSDPFQASLVSVNPLSDGWTETDDVGQWIPPSTSDPDGHWSGAIQLGGGGTTWGWAPYFKNDGCPYASYNYYDQYGNSQLDNFATFQNATLFTHIFEVGTTDLTSVINWVIDRYAKIPPNLPYAITKKPFADLGFSEDQFGVWTLLEPGGPPTLGQTIPPVYDGNQPGVFTMYAGPDGFGTSTIIDNFNLRPHSFKIVVSAIKLDYYPTPPAGLYVLYMWIYVKAYKTFTTTFSIDIDKWLCDHVSIHYTPDYQTELYIKNNWDGRLGYDSSVGDVVLQAQPGKGTSNGIWWLYKRYKMPIIGTLPQMGVTLCKNRGTDTCSINNVLQSYNNISFQQTEVDKAKPTTLFIKAPGNPYPPPGFAHLGSVPLFTKSYDSNNANIPLFIKTNEPLNSSIPLFIYGSTVPLSYDAETMPLFLMGPILPYNAWTTLYTSGRPASANQQSSAFVHDSTRLENFTLFTADDGAGQYTNKYSYSRIRATVNDNSSSRLYQTNSAGHFNVKFEVRFELYIEDQPTDMSLHPIAFTNGIGASSTWASSVEALAVECYNDTGELRLRLKEYLNNEVSSFVDIAEQRRYYIKIVRISNKVTLSVYRDSSYTVLVGSVNLYTTSNVNYQYCIVGDTLDNATGDSMKYILDNLKYEYIFMEGNTTLYTTGRGIYTDAATLYINGFGYTANSYMPLQIYGSDLGTPSYWTDGGITLFLKDTQASNKGRTLFIKNTQTYIGFDPSGTMGLKLFVKGRGDILTDNLPLVVYNEQLGVTFPLFIKGPQQVYVGSQGDSGTLPIYIFRPDESAVIPLMIYNDTPVSNSYLQMFTKGILGDLTGQITLALPDAVGALNTYTDLFIRGAVPITNSLPLVMSSTTGPFNGSIPLFIKHGGGLLNSYINLYIFGANIEIATLPLVIPEVVEIPVDNIILYTQGY